MATENKSKPNNPNKNNKKRKLYLPHNKPVKKGPYPLRPGVQGFFITCDGGREHQASHEAINVIDSFYEELVEGIESKVEQSLLSEKPLNKITKFAYSDSSNSEDDDDGGGGDNDNDDKKNADDHHPRDGVDLQEKEDKDKPVAVTGIDASNESGSQSEDDTSLEKKTQGFEEKPVNHFNKEAETVVPLVKRRMTTDASDCGHSSYYKIEKKSVDQLIEAELAELGDRSKRRFSKLDPGCNGVIFVQMNKRDGDPGPKDIVQHIMTSLASTRKHVSRFLLRVLPIEITCYASEEEIRRVIKPLIDKHFPEETQAPVKFAVLYEARANTGIDRTKIIDAVAKSVPPPHKVDLGNPDVTIVVQIVKTLCLIGIVEKYKELAKYNIRQLTSSTQ